MTPDRVVIAIYASAEFADWLGRLADERGQTTSGAIESAVKRLAESEGFEPPPQRVGIRRRKVG